MKRFLQIAAMVICLLHFSLSLVIAQPAKPSTNEDETVDTATLPGLKTDAALQQSRWDLDRLFDLALEQLPDFLTEIPERIKRVSVVRLEGDEHIYVNTVSLKYKLQNGLIGTGRFQVVECRQCNNMKVYVEDESLILSRTVESNEQIAKLGKDLAIDAYLQGIVTIDETAGSLQFGLQLIDIKDGTILKSAVLNAFSSTKGNETGKTGVAAKQAKKDEKRETDLDLEVLFPKLMALVPQQLVGLPNDVGKVALGNMQEDSTYATDQKRLQTLFENTLVNQTAVRLVECRSCQAHQDASDFESTVFDKRMQKLGRQLGFDAYITSNLKIHEDEEKIEFNFKVIDAKDNSIIKAVSLKTLDEDALIEPNSEHALTFLPAISFSLEGDAFVENGVLQQGKIESMMGIQYRFTTTTIIENLLIGFDVESFIENRGEDTPDEMHASLTLWNLIFKYRLPFRFGNHRMFNAAFGYGTGNFQARVQDFHESVNVRSVKLEGDALITPSFSIGLAVYFMGSHELEAEDEGTGITASQTFKGDGAGIYLRYTF